MVIKHVERRVRLSDSHIKKLRQKDCKGLGGLVVETTTVVQGDTKATEESITQELKSLNELYKSGVLTEEEFTQAKKKLLN